MRRIALCIVMTALVFGPGPVAAEPPEAADGFGAELTLEKTTPLADVLANVERYEKQPVLIRGRLNDVCQRMGCWMVIQDQGAQIRVRFKDYGFVIPVDSIGREALVEGVVAIETLSEKQARHYESESRDGHPDSVKGPRREVAFTATGVRLIRR